MDNKEIEILLKDNLIFASLDESAKNQLLSRLSIVELSDNEILFYQGDPSKNIYLLVDGKLAAFVIDNMGETKILGYISSGETVGEMGVLTDEPRSLNIKALTKSRLIKLPKEDFLEVARQYPDVMFAVIKPLISRSVNLMQMFSGEKTNKSIVIIADGNNNLFNEFSLLLQKTAEKFPSTLFITDDHPDFADKNASKDIIREKIKSLVKSRKSVHRICYILSTHETTLARVALKRAGNVYIAVAASEKPHLNPRLIDIIKHDDSTTRKPSLILIHPKDTLIPLNTNAWLNLTDFKIHHHLRIDKPRDFEKLLRFIRGKAVGIVLGGGGTRGWAHLGAIKALRESKIPVDIIGGSSVGALISALYGLDQSFDDAYEKFRQIVIESKFSVAFRSLTWPVISLFNAKRYTNSLQKTFDETRLENLWLPVFCLTSNLSTNSEQVHQSGLIWEIARASTAIPGIIPPMLLNSQLHLDGGLLNNLPTDIMRNMIGQKSKIIAIQLNDLSPDNKKYFFPPILTLKEAVLCKLKWITRYKFPSFLEIFFRGIFLGSRLKARNNALLATIHVNLDLARFKSLHSNADEGEKLMNMGYEETMKQIKRIKEKNVDIV